MSLSQYKQKINEMSVNNIVEDLQEQIYTNSKICIKKVKFYNIGSKFLLLTILLWFICMSFRLL